MAYRCRIAIAASTGFSQMAFNFQNRRLNLLDGAPQLKDLLLQLLQLRPRIEKIEDADWYAARGALNKVLLIASTDRLDETNFETSAVTLAALGNCHP